jgi:hypothetical protein
MNNTASGNGSASVNGGGVFGLANGSGDNFLFAMNGGTISGNTASSSVSAMGGGVDLSAFSGSVTFTMSGGTIYGNGAGANSNTLSAPSKAGTSLSASSFAGTLTAKYGGTANQAIPLVSGSTDSTLTGKISN